MTDKAKLLESVKKNVRALLISAPMGLSMRELERDYSEVIGDPIGQVALRLGFNSAEDLILNMPDVADARWDRGILVLHGVADKTTERIQRLVSRQKTDKAKIQKKRARVNQRSRNTRDSLTNPYSRQPPPRRTQRSSFQQSSFSSSKPSSFSSSKPSSFPSSKPSYSSSYRPPSLKSSVPAALQNQVKAILRKYPAGIANQQFQETFFRYENYTVNFKKLGYDSLWEFLHAIPDVKTSHTSKEEFDIFLVSGKVAAIPAGYEGGSLVEPPEETAEYVYKGPVSRDVPKPRSAPPPVTRPEPRVEPRREPRPETKPESSKRVLPPRMGGPRMAPSNSRSPWALAGVPQPGKKAPVARGRGTMRGEGPPSETGVTREDQTRYNPGALRQSSRRVERTENAPVPIEQEVDAPFEKEFVDDIRQILSEHPDGIWCIELPDAYQKLTGKPLRFLAMGYYGVIELVSAMPDVVTVVREDSSDWKLYDARVKRGEDGRIRTPSPLVTQENEANLEMIKGQLRMLLDDHDDAGVLLGDLESAFETKYSRRLPLRQLGFQDIDSLVLLIPDAVKIVYKGHGKVYAFSQKETVGVPKYDSKMALLCSLPQDAVGFGYRYHEHQMPPLYEYFEVYVSSVYTPHRITIQVHEREKNMALEELMDDLEAVYKYAEGERYFFPESMIAVNQLCCALYLEDNNWHRGVITGVIDNGFVEVNYVDYGTTLQVPKSCLRLLKAGFLKLPAMAIDARLAAILPREGEWADKARDCLLQLTRDKVLFAQCVEIKSNVLSLYLVDTNTEDDVVIHDVLVQEGFAVHENQKAPVTAQVPVPFDPSDFIEPIAALPTDIQVPLQVQIPDEQRDVNYLQTQFSPIDKPHQVDEAGDREQPLQEEEYVEDDIAVMAEELEGMDGASETDSEDMEEIEENNLNIEDIELTMKFLEGKRKRLLAVLSSEDGVEAIDDLDETEALIRHFESRKRKIYLSMNPESQVNTSDPVDAGPEEQDNSPSEEEVVLPQDEDNQPPKKVEPSRVATLSDLKHQLEMAVAAPPRSMTSGSGGLLPGGILSVDGVVREESEHEPAREGLPPDDHKSVANRSEFPILESEDTDTAVHPPAKPVVDPATLKDLGEMLRSSLKISAEPFKPKATISPFRRLGAPSAAPPAPTSPSAFLDNRDSKQEEVVGIVQEPVVPGLVDPGQESYQQTVQPPQHQLTYEDMVQQFGTDPRMLQHQQQMPGLQTGLQQESFMSGPGQFPLSSQGYPSSVGRGQPFPQQGVVGSMTPSSSVFTGVPARGPHIPQVQRNMRSNPYGAMENQQFDPSSMHSEGLKTSSAGYPMPAPPVSSHRVQSGGSMGSQREQRPDVQQFYSGGLDLPPPMPHVRNPAAAPAIRGMRLSGPPGPNLHFPNPMQAGNFHQGIPGNFQRPPPNMNIGNMRFPPPLPPQGMAQMNSQPPMGGVNRGVYGVPQMGYNNIGNQMYPPGVMGRGRGTNP